MSSQQDERAQRVSAEDQASLVEEHAERFLAANPGAGPCSCAELRDHLFEFLDSELEDSERERLHRHIVECPDCTEAAQAEAHVRSLLRNACAEQAPQGLRARVVAQLTVLRTTTISLES